LGPEKRRHAMLNAQPDVPPGQSDDRRELVGDRLRDLVALGYHLSPVAIFRLGKFVEALDAESPGLGGEVYEATILRLEARRPRHPDVEAA
jgi:hypothetical protein